MPRFRFSRHNPSAESIWPRGLDVKKESLMECIRPGLNDLRSKKISQANCNFGEASSDFLGMNSCWTQT